MDVLLLKMIALLRPLASFAQADALFELAGVGLFLAAVLAFLSKTAVGRNVDISAVDLLIAGFSAWCLTIFVVYMEEASLRDLAKLLIPLLSYTLAKNVIRSEDQFRGFVFWMVVGLGMMATASAIVILLGGGVSYVTYWTGLPRYRGVYTGSHNFGHSMTLFLMVLTIYAVMKRAHGNEKRTHMPTWEKAALGGLAAVALYCLYMSQVRSAILGVLCFAGVYLYFANRKLLITGALTLALIAAVTFPYWLPALLPGVSALERGQGDIGDLGSGRLEYWQHNLERFADLPLDRKIAGVGIGNTAEHMLTTGDDLIDSHNDWLELLVQTGIVGLGIFVALQVAILRAILRLPRTERHVFLALFLGVGAMMLVSNSYVWRIQVGHLYFMLLAFAEVRSSAVPRRAHAKAAAPSQSRTAHFGSANRA